MAADCAGSETGETDFGQRLADPNVGVVTKLVSQSHQPLRRGHPRIELGIEQFRLRRRIVAEVNAFGSPGTQVGIHPFGEKGNQGGQEFRQLNQCVIKGLISGQLVAVARVAGTPEPTTVAADVPVRQVVDEAAAARQTSTTLNSANSRLAVARALGGWKESNGRSPAVRKSARGGTRVEGVEPRIIHEEGIRVPQRNEDLAADLVGRPAHHLARRGTFLGLIHETVRRLERDGAIGMPRAEPQVACRVFARGTSIAWCRRRAVRPPPRTRWPSRRTCASACHLRS